MARQVWNPVTFTAGPLGTFESVYVEDDESLTRRPVLGVLIEELMQMMPDGTLAPAGARRTVFVEQAAAGSRELQVAGGNSAGFAGVFPVGEDPPQEALDDVRQRVEREADEAWGVVTPTGLPSPD